jgi:hypothetical protein
MTRTIHWAGGIRYKRGIRLPGWPCCCSGERCERIASDARNMTRCPQEVTCKRCGNLMRQDDHAERWGEF